MNGGLRDFLVRLATDPDCLSQYLTDPAGTLDRAGLTAEDKAAVLSRDSDRIRGALGASAADHLTQVLNRKASKKAPPKKRPGVKKRPPTKKPGRGGKKR